MTLKMIMSTTGGAHRNAVLELVDDAQGSVEVGGNASNSSYLTGNFDNNDNTAATNTEPYSAVLLFEVL